MGQIGIFHNSEHVGETFCSPLFHILGLFLESELACVLCMLSQLLRIHITTSVLYIETIVSLESPTSFVSYSPFALLSASIPETQEEGV